MNWFTQLFTSTVGRKIIMALTGLFLIVFLIVHLSGNLQLLKADDGKAFNLYAKFMTTNPLIKTASYLLYATFIIHILWSLGLTIYNKKARPVGYAVNASSANSSWSSRNMGILGTIIFIFLVIHLKGFWYEYKFGAPPMVEYEGTGKLKDLYAIVDAAFAQWWYVALYVVSMVFLAFHLAHGFLSAFKTLGLNHKKYIKPIQVIGIAYAIIVPAGFALIPIYMFIENLM